MADLPSDDQSSTPPPLPVKRVAKWPNIVSLIMSPLALLLSSVSLITSWNAHQLNKASLRADVEITQLRYRMPELPTDLLKALDLRKLHEFTGTHHPLLEGTITNLGKSRAINVSITWRKRFWDDRTNGFFVVAPISVPELAPGRTQSAYVILKQYSSSSHIPGNLRLLGFLDYTDEATGVKYHESWCYQAKGLTNSVAEFAFCPDEIPPGPPPPPQPQSPPK